MSDPESHHEDVRKLLRWKRNEQPPPGYFCSFSDKVLARIEAEESCEPSGWWSWLVGRFDARPALVCAYGVAISSLLLLGFRLSQVFEAEVAASPNLGGPSLALTPSSPILLPTSSSTLALSGTATASLLGGTRTAFQEDSSSLFFPQRGMYHLQHVGFSISGP